MKEGWEYKKLSLVCSKITDGSHFSPKVDNNGIYPMLSVKDMMAIGFNYTTCKYINENDYNVLVANGCKPKVNDVLVAKDGSYLKTAFVLKEDKEQALLSSIAIITPRLDEIVPEYLAFYFKAPHTKSVVEKHYLTGTAIKRVILKGFKNITIPVPPLSEQQHIVEELDLLSNIIEKKKAQLMELDNLAQSFFYEMFGDPITNEKGWEVKKLGELCTTSSGGTPSKSHTEYYEGGNIPWLRSGEVAQGFIFDTELFITEEGLKNSSAKYFPIDTVVVAMYGATVGQVGILKKEMTTNQAVCGIFPNKFYVPIFLMYFLKGMKPVYLKDAAGGAQPNISQGVIKNTLVPKVPLTIQQDFVDRIEAIEHQKELIKKSIKEVETLFNSRMDYYFN